MRYRTGPGAKASAAGSPEDGLRQGALVVMPFLDGSRAVVVLAGEADRATASRLQDQVIGSLGSRARSLLLDLSDLALCDQHGVDALSRAVRAAEERGVSVSLRGQSPQVSRLLRTSSHRP